MEFGICRSGRTGSAPRRETLGEARGAGEGDRLRGEMRQPFRAQKRVRRDAEGGVGQYCWPQWALIEPTQFKSATSLPADGCRVLQHILSAELPAPERARVDYCAALS